MANMLSPFHFIRRKELPFPLSFNFFQLPICGTRSLCSFCIYCFCGHCCFISSTACEFSFNYYKLSIYFRSVSSFLFFCRYCPSLINPTYSIWDSQSSVDSNNINWKTVNFDVFLQPLIPQWKFCTQINKSDSSSSFILPRIENGI